MISEQRGDMISFMVVILLLRVLENKRQYLIPLQRLNTRHFLIPLPNLFGYKLVLQNLESRRVVHKFFGVIILG
jgi:hypothetical protein